MTFSKTKWRTVRVVVEVPVRGNYSEKDLVWDVKRVIEGPLDRRVVRAGVQTGLVQVKQMNKVTSNVIRQHVKKRTGNVTEELEKISMVKAAMAKAGLT